MFNSQSNFVNLVKIELLIAGQGIFPLRIFKWQFAARPLDFVDQVVEPLVHVSQQRLSLSVEVKFYLEQGGVQAIRLYVTDICLEVDNFAVDWLAGWIFFPIHFVRSIIILLSFALNKRIAELRDRTAVF